MKIRIHYHHTDCGGVVYYANYLKFLEEARWEFLEARKVYIKELRERGVGFVVARQEIDYKAPAIYGDMLVTDTWLSKISRASLEFGYDVKKEDGTLVVSAKTVLVFVDDKFKPTAIPDDVREKLVSFVRQ